MTATPPLRLALWQCPQQPLDVAGNLQRIDAAAADARARGAALLVCPEMLLTGYAIGAEAAARLAEPADGPSAQAIAAMARRHSIAIVYGYPECHDDPDKPPFNAVQCIDDSGRRLGGRRKTQLYGDMDRAMFSAACMKTVAPSVVEWRGWRIGFAICYDIEFPETARRLALAGADLIVVPTANMAGFEVVSRTLLPARAVENQLYVAYANACGEEGGLRYGGLSGVAAPDGEDLRLAGTQDTMWIADIDPARLAASRLRFPYLRDLRQDV